MESLLQKQHRNLPNPPDTWGLRCNQSRPAGQVPRSLHSWQGAGLAREARRSPESLEGADAPGSSGLSSPHRGWAGQTTFLPPGARCHLKKVFSYLETVCPPSTWQLGNSTPRTRLPSQPGSAPLTPSFLASSTAGRGRGQEAMGTWAQCRGPQPGAPAALNPRKEQQAWLSQWPRLLPRTHLCHTAAALVPGGQCSPSSAPPAVPGHPLELASLALDLSEPTLDPLMDSSNLEQPLPLFSSPPWGEWDNL